MKANDIIKNLNITELMELQNTLRNDPDLRKKMREAKTAASRAKKYSVYGDTYTNYQTALLKRRDITIEIKNLLAELKKKGFRSGKVKTTVKKKK